MENFEIPSKFFHENNCSYGARQGDQQKELKIKLKLNELNAALAEIHGELSNHKLQQAYLLYEHRITLQFSISNITILGQ